MDRDLQRELVGMAEEDERVREELAATGELFQGYAPRMAEVHSRNGEALEKIVLEHGWPGKKLVGVKGAGAAWLILQHAIGSPSLQRGCLPLLKEAAERGDIDPAQVAYLEDRICFFEKRPQRYGTQFGWDKEGKMSPWTLEDPEKVDEYRKSVGLGTLAERIEQMRRDTQDEPRPDMEKLEIEAAEWARRVGWV